MSPNHYDLIVIGAGSAGLSVGIFMGKTGLRVLMIARTEHEIGGECLNDGCIPSKALLHIAHQVAAARGLQRFGVAVPNKISLPEVLQQVHKAQEQIRQHENSDWLRKQGVEVMLGNARFTGKNSLQLNDMQISAKKMVIATGSVSKKLEIPGIESVRVLDTAALFHLKETPAKILIIGGGPIGIELAQALARLGVQVTLVHNNQQILDKEDPQLANQLQKKLEEDGVIFYLHSTVEKFKNANQAIIRLAGGATKSVAFDMILPAIGRQPNFADLQVEKAGIKLKEGKIVCDNKLRTTNKHVLLCGDVAGGLQFSHAAEMQGRLLINNFLSPLGKKLNTDDFSQVLFTQPELASFGLTESMLRSRRIKYEKWEIDFSEDDRATTDGYRDGRMFLLVTNKSFFSRRKILGGSILAPHAGEMIQELILAKQEGLSTNALFDKIYPYPVASRTNQQLVVRYRERELTKIIKSLLRRLFRLRN